MDESVESHGFPCRAPEVPLDPMGTAHLPGA